LKPCLFHYNSDPEDIKPRIGFIAQDLEQIYPNLIESGSYDENIQDNIKAINVTDIIPYLVKAIQELKSEVDELKSKLSIWQTS
jgi:hypothetical protein